MRRKFSVICVACAAAILSAGRAEGVFHFMQIEQVIAGVNGDVTAQAIQLRMRSGGQDVAELARVQVWDATGQNPILVADLEGFMANGSTGDRILIASTAFLQATSPAAVPDFIMAELIPESYLAAGSLTFEEDDGTIYWRLSWGGTGYSGSNLGHSDNDDSLPGVMADFGPPFAGAMPSTTLQALLFPGAATDVSTSNSLDYAVSASPAVFRNNARSAFTVIAAATVMGDVDGDRDVDLVDFGRCVDCLAGPDGVIPDSCTDEDFVSCDLSDDSDVDVLDVAEFYLVMTDP